MKKVDKDKSLVVRNTGIVNFTKLQLGITDKLLKREAVDWLGKAKGFIEKKDYPAAIDSCNEAIAIRPDNTEAYKLSGIARMLIGDISDALEDFEKGIQLAPKAIDVYFERGYLYYELEEYEKAIADF